MVESLDSAKMMPLFDEEFEKVLLCRWSYVRNKDIESTKDLYDNSILQVHVCIHKEKVIVSINPSC
jgi:hypothetical protein